VEGGTRSYLRHCSWFIYQYLFNCLCHI